MKIALLGYGKMGQLVEQAAQARGHQIVERFSREKGSLKDRREALIATDLAIDFTEASCVLPHLELCLSLGKPLIIGTTGWEENHLTAQEMVRKAKGSCLYSPNFSLGIYLFQQIIAYAASLFQPFKDYDVGGIEYHHRQKLDSPSGTAKALTQNLIHHMPRAKDFQFTSVRCGHIPGTHTLQFEGPADSITLTHEARNRQGFAEGAVFAAEWLLGKTGFFSLTDMMKDIS